MSKLIKNLLRIKINLLENKQLADKLYFKNNIINDEEEEKILRITNGGETTKVICDFYLQMKKDDRIDFNKLKQYNNQLKQYNKNFLPVKYFDIYNKANIGFSVFETRGKLIEKLKELPSVALRNLKQDLREPRSSFDGYLHNLEYFLGGISQLQNRDPEQAKKILNKVYKSNTDIKQMSNFVDDKENLLGGEDFTRGKILEIVEENSYDLEVVYNQSNNMIIKVESSNGIKAIGCNSLWCFTYGKGFNDTNWQNYSYNDVVYVIIDFSVSSDTEDFMYVYVKPIPEDYSYDPEEYDDQTYVYDMSNINNFDAMNVLEKFPNFRTIMNFNVEPEEEEEYKFNKEDLDNILTNHKLKIGGEYKTDKGNLLKIIKSIPNDDYAKYFIGIGSKSGVVSIDNLLNYIHNYQLFN